MLRAELPDYFGKNNHDHLADGVAGCRQSVGLNKQIAYVGNVWEADWIQLHG